MSTEHGDEPEAHAAFSQTCRVEWQDTDASGHYHHATVVRWVEAAEASFYETIGIDGLFHRIVPVHYNVDYRSRVWFGDPVTTTLVVEAIGNTSVTFSFVVRCRTTLVAEGRIVNVHFPDGAGASPWPHDLRAAFETAQADGLAPAG